ncbi:MAG TPA: class I SAM-dependent methyltransferase [Bryobacteraceae bacterium]
MKPAPAAPTAFPKLRRENIRNGIIVNEHISMHRSAYDDVAVMYHRLWADWYLPASLPALERLFFSQISPDACVLDLCCGSGHVTKELVRRGYRVTGVDNSAALIELARNELPRSVDLQVQDARELKFEASYDAVLSTFDSLNHILKLDELKAVFDGVHRALKPGGLFVFDMNLEEAYAADLREWSVDIKDASVGLVRGRFDPLSKRASTELIWFVKQDGDCWKQQRSTVEQQCYAQSEILEGLREAGFREIEAAAAQKAGVSAELGYGRTYFAARRLC